MNLADRPVPPNPYDLLPPAPSFTVTSADLTVGEQMPHEFTAAGNNRSPQLEWSGFPAETKAFMVTCFDPDAPTPSGFWHWHVQLPATVTQLAQNAGSDAGLLPAGAKVFKNDTGEAGYYGPKPPQGDRPHRYYFVVHALDVEDLQLDPNSTGARISFNTLFHTLARGVFMATFQH